jgi:NADH dehydrogenase
VAGAIRARIRGQPTGTFRYRDKGIMATIGRKHAVAQTGGLRFTGFAAWLTWLLVHIWYLIDFRNRVVVLTEWLWSYLTYQRGARLITGEHAPDDDLRAGEGEHRSAAGS